MQFLQFLLDQDPVFAEKFNLVVEFGQFVEYFVFVLEVDLA